MVYFDHTSTAGYPYTYPYDPLNPYPYHSPPTYIYTSTGTGTRSIEDKKRIDELEDEVKFLRSIIEKLLNKT